MTKASEFIY